MELPPELAREIAVATTLARRAGRKVQTLWRQDIDIRDKGGGEPVTEADLAAQSIIVEGLAEAFPDDAVLSEEAPGSLPAQGRCWVVDPLDGTSDFVDGIEDFVVMIGLCVDGQPVLGAVHHPPSDALYRGGHGLRLERLDRDADAGVELRMKAPADLAALRLVVSRSHYDPWFDEVRGRLRLGEPGRRGRVGLKVTLLAAGEHDVYLHRYGLKVWDACAPQALLEAAGGRMGTLDGGVLDYGGGDVRLTRGLLATHASVYDEVVVRLGDLVAT
jgi:3'(2'), 5'-bisphosphate nucleotidase